uniref:Glyoxal reductase-like n=1 Tax=Geotrypetes seraphini TaxID=260995 RepID=A0A6P8RWY8_GEOSA|nr:glyoxal reductase-like [Geotrypetes seraphini]XP_033810279.1 glyoxal reductase-like [Geotrypetes seraphini]XP_033810280.1 glyoxal reductase-like [Geotrypetes seraphini]
MESITLNNGIQMPLVGFGTFRIQGYNVVYQCLDAALQQGYRCFDTATVYNNEAEIGKALKVLLPKYGLNRQDIFITSKLAPKDHGPEAEAAGLRSLAALDCDYIDLYLIHWPGKQGWQKEDPRNRESRRQSWESLEKLNQAGRFRSIGVSNYTLEHLKEQLAWCRVRPAVLQVEYHPQLVQQDLLHFCQEAGIHLQAYSSLGVGSLVKKEEVKRVAERCRRTPAQVLLRWAVQQGIGVIPKSASPTRIAENFQLTDFVLSVQDMEELNQLHSDTHYCWDPTTVA